MNTEEIQGKLTLEEKALLMEAKDNWSLNGIEHLGIQSITLSDGPNGLRASDRDGNPAPTTALPAESAIANSWNVELEEKLGCLVGEECRYYRVNILLAPGVNGKRYLKPFEIAIKEGKPWMVMAVYAAGYDGEEAQEALIGEAYEAAAGKDAVVVFIGTSEFQECEGTDRSNIELPTAQTAQLKRLYEVNQNLIAVNASGSAVDLRQVEPYVKGMIHMGLAGAGAGAAIADILFGRINPSGKLSETFPLRLEQTPAYPYFPSKEDSVVYSEGIMVGYRYYDTKEIPVQYPFGFGLSYTTFEYGNMELSSDRISNKDRLEVEVDITNSGKCAGQEVVQMYLSVAKSILPRVKRELKAFQKVCLEPNETKRLRFVLDAEDFGCYVKRLGRFAVESGTYQIQIAASSNDIRCTGKVIFESADDVKPPLDYSNSMKEYMEDSRYCEVMQCYMKKYGLDQMGEIAKIFDGVSLKQLPAFMDYMTVPREQAEKTQRGIYENNLKMLEDL